MAALEKTGIPVRVRTVWLLVLGLLVVWGRNYILLLPPVHAAYSWAAGEKSVEQRLSQYGPLARSRLAPSFNGARLSYPPAQLTLAYFKLERRLDLYAASSKGPMRYLRSYPSTAASGVLGPKLKEGDCQVPEGLYNVSFLNPNSRFHLSLRVNYPNTFDQAMGKIDRRNNLGGDIMIHGNAVSIGCIAIGDEPIEDVFVLAADVGIRNISVVISPVDFRQRGLPEGFTSPTSWTGTLYQEIRKKVFDLPASTTAER